MHLKQIKTAALRTTIIGFAIAGVFLAGCRLFVPQEGWSQKWGPLVPHTSFPGDCGICHVPERWDQLHDDFSFDHEKETGYRLEGAHAAAACLRCHNDRGPVEAYVARGCAGCHVDPHAASMGMDCMRCHSQDNWRPVGLIAEHAQTRFPLMGVHAITQCESCHTGAAAGEFQGASTQCAICHQEDLALAVSPDHISSGWTTDCQECHAPASWAGARIRHDFFALSGGHGGLDCTQCHSSGSFSGLSADCNSCHSENYDLAPNHVAQNYSRNCEQCHNINDWEQAFFDHSQFALTGGHSGLDCAQCHIGGAFNALPTDCNSCHSADYAAAPNHALPEFPLSCEQCHSTTAWFPAAFDHSFFALSGGHSGLNCQQCHSGGIYTGLSTDCIDCHSSEYASAVYHPELNFPSDCTECHTINGWSPNTFLHSFPLRGNHNVSCITCHNSGTTQNFTCLVCHEHRESKMADVHSGRSGYSYDSPSCLRCHPDGED